MTQARSFFEKAIALDPGNIEAMVGLAIVDVSVASAHMTDDWSARFAVAETTISKALSLAPNSALAHVTRGLVQIYTKRASQGIAECEQALALDRNLAVAHISIGVAKYLLGRSAETEAHVNEAIRLSPRDILVNGWFGVAGVAKMHLNADAEAVVWLRRGLDANPIKYFCLGAAHARLGELDEARAAVQAGLALDPIFTIRRFRDASNARSNNPTFLAGRDRMIEGMRLAGVPEG
jgi:tetratricopeptide (TPR) repeat protein